MPINPGWLDTFPPVYYTTGLDCNTTTGLQYCGHCGVSHVGMCPFIKSIEYYPNGTIKRIEYK